MTLTEQLHRSRVHNTGFDPRCPHCVGEGGMAAILTHLETCATQNEADAEPDALAVAREQRRMIAVLKLYQKWNGAK